MKPFVTRRGRHQGLTLLELVVVMVIIAALAGILVPLLPNLARKAHTSSGATNLGEISKAIQLYASQNGDSFPNNLDSLVVGTAVADYIPTPSGDGKPLQVGQLTDAEAKLLRDVGIISVMPMIAKPATSPGDWNPTFYPYGTSASTVPTPQDLSVSTAGVVTAADTSVVLLNPAVAAAKFALPTTGRYVVFGLGKHCTAVSKVMNEAPVWYSPVEGNDPASKYCRFGLVFQVADSATTFNRVRFVGPVEFGPWGTMTKDDNLGYHYSLK